MDQQFGRSNSEDFLSSQNFEADDDEQHNNSIFYPSERPQWMHQMQPVSLEGLSQVFGPLVYEGYVPSTEPGPVYPLPDQAQFIGVDHGFSSSSDLYPQQSAATVVADNDMHSSQQQVDTTTDVRSTRRSTRLTQRQNVKTPPPPKPQRKRGRKKGEKRGPRQALDPGDEFNALHRQATEAFLDRQDHETALQCVLQAISINPEIHSAHVLLSEIYFARGENDKAFAALFSGAHAAPNDPNVWHQLADACLQRSMGDRDTALKQASYCFSRVLNIDQKDFDARFQKAAISKELGYYAKALKDLDTLLKYMPYNSSVLRQIAEVCTDLGDVTKARALYMEALEAQSSAPPTEEFFGWADLIVYIDLVSFSDGIDEAIKVLKQISRGFVGRGNEQFWETIVNDDREWDANHEPRRAELSSFRPDTYPLEWYGTALPLDMRVKLGDLRLTQGKKQEALMHFEWLRPEAHGEGSNVYEYPDLFLQTADSLKTSKDFGEALRYYNALEKVKAYDDVEFWLGIGACAYVCGEKHNAIVYFENAKTADPESAEARTQLSKLYTDQGDRTKAIKNAREALACYEKAVAKSSKRKYERREVREAREEVQNVYKKAYMLTPPPGEQRTQITAPSFSRRARARRRRAQQESTHADQDRIELVMPQDRPDRAVRQIRKRLTKVQRTKEQQEASVHDMYASLRDCTQAMRHGDEEAQILWLECAEALIDEFRSMKSFYPAERYKTFQGYDNSTQNRKAKKDKATDDTSMTGDFGDDLLPSIESVVPDNYCGIAFPAWLDVFLEYALLLANLQYEPAECYTIINAAQDCTIWYHDTNALTQIYTCYVVCALALHDEGVLFGTALRWFMREYAFCSDVYRLFSALNFYFPYAPEKGGKPGQMANAKFRIPPNQKFLFRHLVSLDSQLPEDYGVGTTYGPVPAFMRKERHEAGLGYLRLQEGTSAAANDDQSLRSNQSQIETASAPTTPIPEQRYLHEPLSVAATRPKEMEIHLLIVYGQILYAGNSFPNALSYFYRAKSLSPNNPVLLLTMALSYLHQMLKRQCDNRHMYFLQGLALFEQYAQHRLSWAEDTMRHAEGNDVDVSGLVDVVRREIEFNRARCWHMVGMADLALRGYERMIEMKPVKREGEDPMDVDSVTDDGHYSMEAAYSMALLYATNGDTQTAKEITEKWLVVE